MVGTFLVFLIFFKLFVCGVGLVAARSVHMSCSVCCVGGGMLVGVSDILITSLRILLIVLWISLRIFSFALSAFVLVLMILVFPPIIISALLVVGATLLVLVVAGVRPKVGGVGGDHHLLVLLL